MVPRDPADHRRIRTGYAGLPAQQLHLAPISEERISEAAGVNSAAGNFGLSFGLAFAGAIMLATLAFLFTSMSEESTVLSPDQQQRVAVALEEDAQVMSNTQLQEVLAGQPQELKKRSFASTRTCGPARSRSRCSCRSSPASSAWCFPSGRCACPTSPSASLEGVLGVDRFRC